MIIIIIKIVCRLDCSQVEVTWFLVADVDVKTQNDDVGEEGSPPVDDKHDDAAQDGSRQRHPHVVVLEAGTPTWSGREQASQKSSCK